MKDLHIFLDKKAYENLRLVKAHLDLSYKKIFALLFTDKIEDIKKMFDISF